MARARNIKPSFFQNEKLGELDPLARLAFIGMWTIADYKGCVEFRPKRLKVQLLPYDECDMEQLAINLEKSGFVRMYSVSGERYLKIVNFEKHQNPHKNEREAGSEIPDIPEISNNDNELQNIQINREENGTAPADSLNLIPSSLIPDSPNLNPSVTAAEKSAAPRETELQASCKQTWAAYAEAFTTRYGTKPVRNASVNSQIKQFVSRLGFEEAPQVAAFYVTHNEPFYVKKAHSVGSMLADAEKLRTEWATGRNVVVADFKTAGERRNDNTDKAIAEFLGKTPDNGNVIEGEYHHA